MLVSLHTGEPSTANECKFGGYDRMPYDDGPVVFPKATGADEIVTHFALWEGDRMVDAGPLVLKVPVKGGVTVTLKTITRSAGAED